MPVVPVRLPDPSGLLDLVLVQRPRRADAPGGHNRGPGAVLPTGPDLHPTLAAAVAAVPGPGGERVVPGPRAAAGASAVSDDCLGDGGADQVRGVSGEGREEGPKGHGGARKVRGADPGLQGRGVPLTRSGLA